MEPILSILCRLVRRIRLVSSSPRAFPPWTSPRPCPPSRRTEQEESFQRAEVSDRFGQSLRQQFHSQRWFKFTKHKHQFASGDNCFRLQHNRQDQQRFCSKTHICGRHQIRCNDILRQQLKFNEGNPQRTDNLQKTCSQQEQHIR